MTVRDIGYTHSDMGFDANTCAVLVAVERAEPRHRPGRRRGRRPLPGAGRRRPGHDVRLRLRRDPGAHAGMSIYYSTPAHREACPRSGKNGTLPYLRPDGKSQVTVEYRDGKVVRVDAVVISTQHAEDVEHDEIRESIIERGHRVHHPARAARLQHPLLRQPHRSLRHRWSHGRCRRHRPQDHRRHLRRPRLTTVAAPSPARTRPRSTAPRPT